MKKLLLVFVSFFALTLLSACGKQDSRTVRFDADGSVIEDENNIDLNEDETLSAEALIGETDVEAFEEEQKEAMEDNEEKAELEAPVSEDEAPEAMEKVEEKAPEKEMKKEAKKVLDKLSITSLDGAFLETSSNKNVIEGSVSKETHSIKVNDYSLKNFIPGQTEWNYTASTNFGTLKTGWNDYVVKTYDKKGDELESLMFSINYEGVEVAALPSVGANLWISLLIATLSSFAILNRKKFALR